MERDGQMQTEREGSLVWGVWQS